MQGVGAPLCRGALLCHQGRLQKGWQCQAPHPGKPAPHAVPVPKGLGFESAQIAKNGNLGFKFQRSGPREQQGQGSECPQGRVFGI